MADRITPEQEAALAAAEKEATPAPWVPGPRATADYAFVCAARNLMPALLAELAALREENEKLKKAARHAYFAMPMCIDCWNNERPKRFVAGRHLHFRLEGEGPPLVWPVDGASRVFAYCDKHKPTECGDGFVEFTVKMQVEAIVELEALGMPEVTG